MDILDVVCVVPSELAYREHVQVGLGKEQTGGNFAKTVDAYVIGVARCIKRGIEIGVGNSASEVNVCIVGKKVIWAGAAIFRKG